MKKILILTTLLATLALTACHQTEDDIFTTADITLSGGDTIQIERVQATARFTDLNAKRTTSSADFEDATLRVQLLRSSYSVTVEGIVRYRNRQGTTQTKRMRAYTDYVSFAAKGYNATTLNIIFME